jgi:Domain of unknown function (DUF6457)
VQEWLAKQADALAAATGIPRDALELEDGDVLTLLDLAKLAAHEGGERTNAPLLCYLLGIAHGSAEIDELAEIVRSTS